ncbi:MAG: 50S ribosomal protein P1 [Candidatus Lokiarchaeota archaeon]|nr:50S ribosomal protein P1 [Candidatus Lokiarchaeota archaeon]
MENIYSALLLHALGKEISEDSVEKVVKAAGGAADKTQIKTLVKAVGEMNLKDVLASAAMMTAPAAAPAAAAPAAPAEEKKGKGKKEEKEEKKEEAEPVGLDALFG